MRSACFAAHTPSRSMFLSLALSLAVSLAFSLALSLAFSHALSVWSQSLSHSRSISFSFLSLALFTLSVRMFSSFSLLSRLSRISLLSLLSTSPPPPPSLSGPQPPPKPTPRPGHAPPSGNLASDFTLRTPLPPPSDFTPRRPPRHPSEVTPSRRTTRLPAPLAIPASRLLLTRTARKERMARACRTPLSQDRPRYRKPPPNFSCRATLE